MSIRLLRGMVVIREDYDDAKRQFPSIIVPDVSTRDDKDAIARDRTSHRGTVLAMGAPAITKTGAEVPHGFSVGDSVVFHFEHYEKGWTRPWADGERAVWVPQVCVDGVVNA